METQTTERRPKLRATPKAKEAVDEAMGRTPKPQGNGAKIQALLERDGGATLKEMGSATDWKPHSIRAYISAGLAKKGIVVVSTKTDGGERVYRIEAQEGV